MILLIIIEIVLTIVAITRGWKWWIAMLPIVISFVIGMGMGSTLRSIEVRPTAIFLDVICIIILFAMIYFNPGKQIDKKSEAK